MEPAGVVPALDVIEDGPAEPGPGGPGAVVDEFPLDGGEEALSDGVIPAFPFPGDGQDHAVCPGQGGVITAGVLAAAVAVEDHAISWAPPGERHRQGVLDEAGAHVVRQRPAD